LWNNRPSFASEQLKPFILVELPTIFRSQHDSSVAMIMQQCGEPHCSQIDDETTISELFRAPSIPAECELLLYGGRVIV
jgi:hypothetical protein